ncbi:hypothetical protein [Calothrix sp. UHCC 0171]|uniref:hypothetical protein n=1 Tax=Calothrix sp. UHCC 0171 TaxID=3110245 RepID=UPI002B20B212|nr:hypothetical protein [Calothrix sp. UHCC 0171]MEA5569688.1 hypothetical protein [Calothrix sp. UHCC 0171]
MRKKSASTAENKGKTKLGDKIRNIADRLKQETEVQIKATSRILGAAAQISENHEKLIHEVVEMVEEDIERQQQMYQTNIYQDSPQDIYQDIYQNIYTVEILKQKFKTLREAKEKLQVKAVSWESLVNKLNSSSSPKILPEIKSQSVHNSESDIQEENEGLKIYLEADVAKIFPNSQSVNEALRFLIRVTNQNYYGTL